MKAHSTKSTNLIRAGMSALFLALGSSSCGLMGLSEFKGDKMLQIFDDSDKTVRFSFQVKEIAANKVDVLWVIDNSGSMGDEQDAIRRSTDSFMANFTKSRVNWKMGLLSSSVDEMPYIGFAAGNELDSSIPDPAARFSAAVGRLGINGDVYEKFFSPVLQQAAMYPFLRPGAPLALVLVTDEEEQSRMTAQTFVQTLRDQFKVDRIFSYIALAANDVPGCGDRQGHYYKGSAYEQLNLLATQGKLMSLCTDDFSKGLSDMTKEIVQLVERAEIPLTTIPDPETIRIFHHDTELPGGPREEGGLWTYDSELNAIVFYNLNFVEDENESVRIAYTPAGLPVEIP